MAELQASWIQGSSHPSDTDRLVLEGLMNPAGAPVSGAAYGVGQAANDLKVQAAGTPNMSVDVLSGHGWIDGTEAADQGTYHVYNNATKNLVISAAHATLARKDLVVANVQDGAYSGIVNAWSLAVVTGTAAGSPTEPAVPANAIVLAVVDVAAAAASITNANITDRRRRAAALGGITVCTSATRPSAPYVGQLIYETDTQRVLVWNGTNWTTYRLGNEPPVYYTGGLANGTATSMTAFLTQNSVLALPYPFTMLVEATINHGGNAVANTATFQVQDETGAAIDYKSATFLGTWDVNEDTNDRIISHIIGKKDYAAAANAGFRLAYKVSGSNIYLDAAVKVSFQAR